MSESKNLPSADAPTDPTELFRQNLLSKFSENLGELMPPEILQKIVAEAVESHLFRKVNIGTHYSPNEVPWIQKELGLILTPEIRKAVQAAVEDQKEEIESMLLGLLKEQLPQLITRFFAEAIASTGAQMGIGIGDILRSTMTRQY